MRSLRRLVRNCISWFNLKSASTPSDLVLFYKACVRSGVDYAVPVFYNALPQYLKNELVRIEKSALSIILPRTGYTSACGLLGITPITQHHSLLCSKLFDQICFDTGHKSNAS